MVKKSNKLETIDVIFSFQRGTFVSEPAILVKRKSDANQIWSIEKLDLKLIDMRELYEDLKVSFLYNYKHYMMHNVTVYILIVQSFFDPVKFLRYRSKEDLVILKSLKRRLDIM